MKIICISDTHNKHKLIDIPSGDVIVHSGDFTEAGTKAETLNFLKWFSLLPHQHKILVAGNHDFFLEKKKESLNSIVPENIYYLENSGVTIDMVNFWGSPFTPGNGMWAFNNHPGKEMQEHWKKIPANTDFLITHSPPFGFLDELDNKTHIGCEKLAQRVQQLKLPYHVFGHNHNDYGIVRTKETVFINASSLDNSYRPINAPLVIHTQSS
jgi:Icc-related predicted phosphoesterase